MRSKSRGIPAASFLANRGISRHGVHCSCLYCAPSLTAEQREGIPNVPALTHVGGEWSPGQFARKL